MLNVTVTKRLRFTAGHRLYNPELSEAENLAVFGPCSYPSGHGHNYILEVTVAGPIDPRTGMIMNLKDLGRIVEEQVISQCDHRNFNVDVEFTRGLIPTAENLARRMFEVLDAHLPQGTLVEVKLFETENNIAVARRKGV